MTTSLRRTAFALACYALAGGLTSLAGWAFDVQRLTDWRGSGISILPNTAIAVIAAASGTMLLCLGHRRMPQILGGLACLIGASALFEHLAGVDLGIDARLLFGRTWGRVGVLAPGRMGPPAAVSWALIGAALVFASRGTKARAAVPPLASVTLGISSLSLVGYLYGAQPLYTLPRLTIVALQTSTFIFATSLALLLSVPERAPVRHAIDMSVAGVLIRRAVPILIVVPIVLGFIRLQGDEAGIYDVVFGTALRTVAEIVLLLALLWWTAGILRRHARLANSREQDAQTNAHRLAGLLGSLKDPFLTLDANERFSFVNDAAVALMAKSRSELVGKEIRELFPDAVNNEAYRGLRRAMTERVPVENESYYAPGRRWFFYRAYPVDDGGLAVFLRDVTERKTHDESLRTARADAERANAIKDEFLATLSHELRSPLNAIVGWVHVLEKRGDDPALLQEGIEVIARNAKAQHGLIADLLDMSRIISGKIHLDVDNVALSSVIAESIETMRPAAEGRQIRLSLAVSAAVDLVRGDANRLQQVMCNLLSNAVKFTPKGGRIQVTLAQVGSQAEIVVSDTGAGIRPELLPYVFDRFRQGDASTTRSQGGLGLGLAIVKQLVELHGGSVRAESPGEGRGATFTVALPLPVMHQPERDGREAIGTASPSETQPADQEISLDGVTALVVEDQHDARELLRVVLERRHAKVITAQSAGEALRLLETHKADIILCDVGMPGTDGYDFITELRRKRDPTPALAVTAFARTEDKVRALRAGFHAHLSKPIEPAELLSTVAVFARSDRSARGGS